MRKIVPIVTIASFVAIAFVSCGAKSSDVSTNEGGFKQVEEIDMVFQWRVVGDTLEMKATSPGLGWISVGFDAEMIMKGADYVIGYVADGEGFVEDHYGHQVVGHELDTVLGGTDDVTLIAVSESAEDGTMLHFSIPLDSGDEYDKTLVEGQTHKIQLAYHVSNDDFVSRHSENARIEIAVEL